MDIKLTSVVYDWIKAEDRKVIDCISPSMLGGCMRAHYFAIKHIPQTTPPNPGALLNFYLGKMWETPVEKALEKSGIEYIDQYYMEDKELNVKGTLDLAIHHKDTDEWEVIDIKTESIMSEKYRAIEHKTFIEASERYVIQLGTYMYMLRRQGKKVSRGRFLVVVKDNGLLREFFVPYTQELEDKVVSRINKLNQHLKDGTIPDCECEGWVKDYCGYGDPTTQVTSKTGKVVNTTCCDINLIKGE